MCWLALNNPRYKIWASPLPEGVEAAKPTPVKSMPAKAMVERLQCVHLGGIIVGQPCGSPLRRCNYDNTVCSTLKPCKEAVRCCQSCKHFEKEQQGTTLLIPKIIHRVWVGPKPIPDAFGRYWQTWRDLHPEWELRTWRDADIPTLGDECVRLCKEARNPAEMSDVMRYFIVEAFGGVYVDTDFEAWKNIEPVLFGREFVSSYEPSTSVACGFFASIPHHPIMMSIVDELKRSTIDTTVNQVETVGPLFFTRHIKPHLQRRGVYITPVKKFYPFDYGSTGTKEQYPDAYAAHHWAHTWKDDWTTLTIVVVGTGKVESTDSLGPSDVVLDKVPASFKTLHWCIVGDGQTLTAEGIQTIRNTLRWAPNHGRNDFAFRTNKGGWWKVYVTNDKGLPLTRLDDKIVIFCN